MSEEHLTETAQHRRRTSNAGNSSFNHKWTERTIESVRIAEWLAAYPEDEHKAFCTVCQNNFTVVRGYYGVTQHANAKKHQENLKNINQCHFKAKGGVLGLVGGKKAVLTGAEQRIYAEGIFAAHQGDRTKRSIRW